MEGALSWLGDLMQFIGKFFPRVVIITTTHAGIKFVRGHKVVVLEPGVHVYWPLVTELESYPVARQAVDLRSQTLVTMDEKTIAAGALIVYEIRDIESILAHTYDPEDTVRDVALSAVHDVLCRLTWAEIRDSIKNDTLEKALKHEAYRGLTSYGVRVLRLTLTDLAPCRVIKLLNENPTPADVTTQQGER
jgi:regulator of protease activity HflC (stomatin/prohibitin superfamily)